MGSSMSGVRIYEVGLRDGLQNESGFVKTDDKLRLAHELVQAGFKDIEVGSFVSPRYVPQMADTDQLFRRLEPVDGVRFWALVPNRRGLERALDAGVRNVATFMSASETHNIKNVNRTMRESLDALKRVVQTARAEGLGIRSYISTVFGCPYEGNVSVTKTIELSMELLEAGASEIALGDTTGMGTPLQVQSTLKALSEAGVPLEQVACHFHDTRGTAVANAFAAWQSGIRSFDGSLGGIGGCPYAPGATGNASTEDLVHMFDAMGQPTGVDLTKTCAASEFLETVLGKQSPGRYLQYDKAARSRNSKRDVEDESNVDTESTRTA